MENEKNRSQNLSKASEDLPRNSNANKNNDEHTSDKYLAMEQPGVTYTKAPDSLKRDSDKLEDHTEGNTGKWQAGENNSRNAEAFNQDEDLLNDNIDLDEDQSLSVSSDDK